MPEKTENKTARKDVQSEVIEALAEEKILNMWSIKKQTNLCYSSVHKAVKTLQKESLIQQGKPEDSKKGGKTTRFRLTFRGFIRYLASRPEPWKPTETAMNIIESHGKQLDYAIFKEIRWLTNHYGPHVFQAILDVTTIIEDIPLLPVGAARMVEKLKKRKASLEREKRKELENWKKIEQRIKEEKGKTVSYVDLLPTTTLFTTGPDGKEERGEPHVYNPIAAIEEEIQDIEKHLEIFRDHENQWCRRRFATLFAQRLRVWRRKENMQNEALYKLFKQAAEDTRNLEVTPLENAAETFKTSTI